MKRSGSTPYHSYVFASMSAELQGFVTSLGDKHLDIDPNKACSSTISVAFSPEKPKFRILRTRALDKLLSLSRYRFDHAVFSNTFT